MHPSAVTILSFSSSLSSSWASSPEDQTCSVTMQDVVLGRDMLHMVLQEGAVSRDWLKQQTTKEASARLGAFMKEGFRFLHET